MSPVRSARLSSGTRQLCEIYAVRFAYRRYGHFFVEVLGRGIGNHVQRLSCTRQVRWRLQDFRTCTQQIRKFCETFHTGTRLLCRFCKQTLTPHSTIHTRPLQKTSLEPLALLVLFS